GRELERHDLPEFRDAESQVGAFVFRPHRRRRDVGMRLVCVGTRSELGTGTGLPAAPPTGGRVARTPNVRSLPPELRSVNVLVAVSPVVKDAANDAGLAAMSGAMSPSPCSVTVTVASS